MTNFNGLPLVEKIQQAQKGDVIVTDTGARLPSVRLECLGVQVRISSTAIDLSVPYEEITDIIRPSEKQEVPEIVEWLRQPPFAASNNGDVAYVKPFDLCELAEKLADHFEKETRK